jgi:hypothetical protein
LPDGDCGQNDIIDFHHAAVLATICFILLPAPSALQEDSSDAWAYTRGSVGRASSFVLTDKPAVIPGPKSAYRREPVYRRRFLTATRVGISSVPIAVTRA